MQERTVVVGGPLPSASRHRGVTTTSNVERGNIKAREFANRPHNEALLRGLPICAAPSGKAQGIRPIMEVA